MHARNSICRAPVSSRTLDRFFFASITRDDAACVGVWVCDRCRGICNDKGTSTCEPPTESRRSATRISDAPRPCIIVQHRPALARIRQHNTPRRGRSMLGSPCLRDRRRCGGRQQGNQPRDGQQHLDGIDHSRSDPLCAGSAGRKMCVRGRIRQITPLFMIMRHHCASVNFHDTQPVCDTVVQSAGFNLVCWSLGNQRWHPLVAGTRDPSERESHFLDFEG